MRYADLVHVVTHHIHELCSTPTLVRRLSQKATTDNKQVALETEVDNAPSLRLYASLGFLRSKRLHRYYLNGNEAFRLLLYLKEGVANITTYPPEPEPAELEGSTPDDLGSDLNYL